ncbi:hypothetical protein VTN00DRAFT_4357 [Thermoascus crustaceus]|uniref:uncharacterized protein n=1 Tax=Thermoascus crustaceus TaxID=5088 RepID=UPI0037430737
MCGTKMNQEDSHSRSARPEFIFQTVDQVVVEFTRLSNPDKYLDRRRLRMGPIIWSGSLWVLSMSGNRDNGCEHLPGSQSPTYSFISSDISPLSGYGTFLIHGHRFVMTMTEFNR